MKNYAKLRINWSKEINMQEMLTIPIRFSRHKMTELLVAAEHTASLIPYNIQKKSFQSIVMEVTKFTLT